MYLHDLKFKWQQLFVNVQGDTNLINQLFIQVVELYSSPNRYYHNLLHIHHVLNVANTLKPLAHNFPAIEMAAWFHDIIYDPQAEDNEERSANLATNSLISLKVSQTTINQVVRMILQTKKHHATLADIDTQILLDADLSILGAKPSVYMAYAQAIRQEYGWLSDLEYQVGRQRVLQTFLERDKIFLTEKAFQMFEFNARENITLELSTL